MKHVYGEWKSWFAWYPVRLVTMQWAWLRTVQYRERPTPDQWSYGKHDYAN